MSLLSSKIRWLFGSFLLLLALPETGWAQWKLTTPDCAFPTQKRYYNYVADDQPITAADSIKLAKARAKMPSAYPKPHAIDLAQSERAYADGHFAEAADQLKAFANQDPPDPSLLNQYARSLYHVPDGKSRSYAVYHRLVSLLDRYGGENASTCVVYLPFSEAYYKLATLQMDNAQWSEAAYNISRALLALAALPDLKQVAPYEEMLKYQTECFAELGNVKLCHYYGQRTLKLFPKNQYVRPYLARLPPSPKPKAKR